MEHSNKEELIDVTDTNQSDITWAFRKYQCPKYIFAEEYDRQKLKEEILKTHRIKDAIEKYKQEANVDANTAYKEAVGILDEISHAFSLRTIRFMALVIMRIIRQVFQKVIVNKNGINRFRDSAKLTPIVLVPTHSSYFDFILASYICFALDLPLPAIVAGQDFLAMAIVNRLLRGSGAFYMRRSFASDGFYRSIFTGYTQYVLCSGERPIEFFPEGTRSRCGKALQPKLGLLSMVLESFFHGYVQDVSFIPMSISYEKITEEQLYLFELLGIPKPKESLSGLLKARSILNSDFGMVSVHFGEIMSLREYCLGKIDGMDYVSIPRCERHLKIFGREEQEMKIAKYFGEKLIFTQQQSVMIFPRAVVAALMLNNSEVKLGDLTYKVDVVGKLLGNLGCKLHGFDEVLMHKQSITNAIKFSDCVLSIGEGDTVNCSYSAFTDSAMKETKLFQVFKKSPHLITQTLSYIYLSMQRNKLMHFCICPSIMVHAIKENQMSAMFKDSFMFLYQLLKVEFIFDPDVSPEQSFCDTVRSLIDLKVVCERDLSGTFAIRQQQIEVEFLTNLLQPFIDAYLLVMHCLLKHIYEFPISLKVITSEIQIQAAELVALTHVGTFESISLHTLSNCITSLCKMNLLTTIKNSIFENLVNSVNTKRLLSTRHKLARYASPKLRMFTEQSRL